MGLKPGDSVNIPGLGVQPVTAITEGGLVQVGDRMFHDSGVEMNHEPGPKLRFEKVLESEVAKREMDP